MICFNYLFTYMKVLNSDSRMYNELAILKMTQSLSLIAINPLHVFKEEIIEHLKSKWNIYIDRLESWLSLSERKINLEAGSISKDKEMIQNMKQLHKILANTVNFCKN